MDVFDALSDDPRKLRGSDYVNHRLSRKTTTEIHKFQAKHLQGKKAALLHCLHAKKAVTDTEAETTLKKIRSKFVEVKSHEALELEDPWSTWVRAPLGLMTLATETISQVKSTEWY